MFFGLWSMDFCGQSNLVHFSFFSRRGEKEGRTTTFMYNFDPVEPKFDAFGALVVGFG